MRKIDWKTIGDGAGQVCKAVGYGVLTLVSIPVAIVLLADKMSIEISDNKCSENTTTGYMDVVRTIIDEVTFTSDQKKIISLVKKDGTADYYETVEHIIKNTVFASDIVGLIERLNEQ